MKTINFKSLSIIFAMFFAIPLFFSCKSDDEEITYYNTYIDGYFTDYNTGYPIKDIYFDIYYGCSNGNVWGYRNFYYPKAYKTDNNGYYKILIPKTINGRNTIYIDINPLETEDYGFQRKELHIKEDSLDTKSKRINITPISYAYLKITLPIKDGIFLFGAPATFEIPSKTQRLINIDTLDNSKVFLYTVASLPGQIKHLINNSTQGPIYNFVVNMPKDTVTLDLTE